jgi:hypothetical protein
MDQKIHEITRKVLATNIEAYRVKVFQPVVTDETNSGPGLYEELLARACYSYNQFCLENPDRGLDQTEV